MTDATLLRTIRAHFDLPQAALAGWLGLGRSMVALIETGREPLPRHARPWLRPWEEALALPDDPTVPALAPFAELPPAPTTGPAAVRARLLECEYQARRLHQQLGELLAAHRKAARHLAAGPLLRAALPPAPAGAEAEPPAQLRRRRWLGRLLEAAGDALLPEAANGPTAAVLLAFRVRAQLHEAAELRAWLAGAA